MINTGMNYLYRITNLINNKIYIGVHQTDNADDGYMGSGTAILRAIKKYGIENFKKDIIDFYDTYDAALLAEEMIVDKDFLLRKDVYNLRTGGTGGWEHMNNVPIDERKNIKEFRRKIASGELKVGGTDNWTDESRTKIRKTSFGNLIKLGIIDPNHWKNLSENEKRIRKQNISKLVSGENNGNYGTHSYIEKDAKDLKNKIICKEGNQPAGWITTDIWRNQRKKKNSPNYGRSWYNDGIKNFYLMPNSDLLNKLNLVKGRLITK